MGCASIRGPSLAWHHYRAGADGTLSKGVDFDAVIDRAA
jgi:hypothetical protein